MSQNWTQPEAIEALESVGYKKATDHILCHYDLPCPDDGSVVLYRKRCGHIDVFVVSAAGEANGPKTYHQSRAQNGGH